MAYVSLNENNKSSILNRITGMCQAEANSLGPTPKIEYSDELAELILRDVWESTNYDKFYGKLPSAWVSRVEYANVLIPDGTPYRDVLYFYFQSPTFYPPNRSASYKVSISPERPEVQTYLRWFEAQKDCSQRWARVRDQVTVFLDNCKSLNEALKLWPSLEVYIPADLMNKVSARVTRTRPEESKAAQVLQNIDVDMVQAAAVIARMSTQTGG